MNVCVFTLHTLTYIGHDNGLLQKVKMGYLFFSTNHTTPSVKIITTFSYNITAFLLTFF